MTMTALSAKQVSLLSMHAVNSPGVSPRPPSPQRGASRVGGPSLRLQSGCAPKHLLQQIPQHEVHQGEAHICLLACKVRHTSACLPARSGRNDAMCSCTTALHWSTSFCSSPSGSAKLLSSSQSGKLVTNKANKAFVPTEGLELEVHALPAMLGATQASTIAACCEFCNIKLIIQI